MTVGQYIVASGISGTTEQDTLDHLDAFITGALGWKRLHYDHAASDASRVWYSEGEEPGKYHPLYFKVRATSNDLRFSIFTNWNQGLSSGSDEISDLTYLQIANAEASDDYVFMGNKDFVFVSIRLNSNGSNYLGGAGYWDTFYTPEQDPYPALAFGQNSNVSLFSTTPRVWSYAPDRSGFLEAGSTYSGTDAAYVAQDRNLLTAASAPNPRNNRYLMLKQDFYTARSRTDGGMPGSLAHEQRGEIPGLYQFHGADFVASERIVASGISVGNGVPGEQIGQGDWIVLKGSSTNTYTVGPVVDWVQTPNTITSAELWLKADAHHYVRGTGGVQELVDLTVNTNRATQATVADQPIPVASVAGYEDQAVCRFTGTEHLTGTLTIVDGFTAFVVADYTTGLTRCPLFTIRGAVGADDTILSLEFNTVISNSAEVTSQSDDTPSEKDVERVTGLSADTPYVLSVVVSGTTTTLYVNGDTNLATTITDTRVTVAGTTELNYAIGATLDSSGVVDGTARHEGNIAEVVAYARDLTNEEHQDVVCYLGNRYGITVSGTCG